MDNLPLEKFIIDEILKQATMLEEKNLHPTYVLMGTEDFLEFRNTHFYIENKILGLWIVVDPLRERQVKVLPMAIEASLYSKTK